MKMHRWSLASLFFFLLSILFSPPSSAQDNLQEIIKKIQPSVVSIITYDDKGKVLNQGSGFFISKEGDIITNLHLLEGASRSEIKTADGKHYNVTRVMAEDTDSDLVKVSTDIQSNSVQPIALKPSLPKKGSKVIIISSPQGFEKTIQEGTVSAIKKIKNGAAIQINASLTSYFSGCPVINTNGEVIGISNLQTIDGQNINFAISSERIEKLKIGKGETLTERKERNAKEGSEAAKKLYLTGIASYWTGNYEKACSYFEEALKENPGYSAACLKISSCYYAMDLYKESVEACKKAISIKPDYAEAYNSLGYSYFRLKHYKDANEAFKEAIRLKPEFADPYAGLALINCVKKQYKEAVEYLQKAIAIEPDHAYAHYLLGVTYLYLKDKTSAIKEYYVLRDINKDYADSLNEYIRGDEYLNDLM